MEARADCIKFSKRSRPMQPYPAATVPFNSAQYMEFHRTLAAGIKKTTKMVAMLLLGRNDRRYVKNWLEKRKVSSANSPFFITNFIFSLAIFFRALFFLPELSYTVAYIVHSVDQQKGKCTALEWMSDVQK